MSTCARCGLFLCEGCVATLDPPLCGTCGDKAADPLGILAERFSVGASIRNGWRLFSASMGPIALINVIFSIPLAILGNFAIDAGASVQTLSRIERLYDGTIGLLANIACLSVMAAVARGRRWTLGGALSQGLSCWPRIFFVNLWAKLIILFFTLLLIVPGIMRALSYALVTPAAYVETQGDALARSAGLTRGYRWPLLGLYLVAVGAMVVVVMAVGALGAVVDEAAMNQPTVVMLTGAVLDWASRVGMVWVLAVSLAAYFGLRRLKD